MNWSLRPAHQFETFSAKWDRINNAGPASPLLDSRFIAPLLEMFGSGQELLAFNGDPEQAHTVAILSPSNRRAVWSTFQPSQAPLGAWVTQDGSAIKCHVSELLRTLPGVPLVLGVTQQDPALIPRPANQNRVETIDYIRTARITVSGSFDEYWTRRGKNLRQNLRRQRNRLEKDGVVTRLDWITSPGDMASAVADYGRIESGGWKEAGGTAIHPQNAQGQFYTNMLESFARTAEALVIRYRYDDTIAAMDLCIVSRGALIILKTTYDERFSKTSPAMLMREEAFRRIFEEGLVQVIEFYGKVMDWHTRWTDEIRTMYHINCYRWGILARLRSIGKLGRAER
ncbi:MAG: GNAT family N-acetyltransferase [Nitrococcus sp.]|nr:GNAT family N-acetyltransferase [Nitrococcus sp.]